MRRSTRRTQHQQGFNLLEVMIALVVMMVAVTGVASLQSATTTTNMAARNRTAALDFLQTWLERAKIDAMAWERGATAPSLFLNNADGIWFTPNATQLGSLGEMSANFWGWDTTTTADMRYCVNLRGTPLTTGQLLRADVRVWWYREGGDSVISGSTSVNLPDGGSITVSGPIASKRDLVVGCGTAATAPINDPRVFSVTASTILVALQ